MKARLCVTRRRVVGWRASDDGAKWTEAAVALELHNAPGEPGGLVHAHVIVPADKAPAEAPAAAVYLLTLEREP